jgi:hypothetical protein
LKKAIERLQAAAVRFWASEEGNLRDLTWEVGVGVVVVAIIVILLTVARDTTFSIWSRFVNYVTGSFGF